MKKPTTDAFYLDSQPFHEIEVISTNYKTLQRAFETFLKNSNESTHKLFWLVIFFHHACGFYSSAF